MSKKLLSAPYLVWMIGFTIIPLALIVYYGLTDRSGAFTLENIMAIATPERMNALIRSLKPVSYTHLDVYKRQGVPDQFRTAQTDSGGNRLQPDVYKRQILWRSEIREKAFCEGSHDVSFSGQSGRDGRTAPAEGPREFLRPHDGDTAGKYEDSGAGGGKSRHWQGESVLYPEDAAGACLK